MSDATRTIDLIFNGVDKTGAATMGALGNAEKFAGKLQEVTQPISDFTLGMAKFEGAILAGGVALTLFAVKNAADFDTAFREIATLIPKPIAELGAFEAAIRQYAANSTKPMEEVTRAIYDAISAGVPFEESIKAVSEAEKLSVAGKADLVATNKVLVSSLNAYALGMDEAGRFSDALFTTVKLGQTTLPELAASLSNVTGAAAAVGVPFETVLSAIAALTASGTPTAQAVTQINAVLTSLLKPSKEAADEADRLGIGFGVQAVKAKGLDGVLQDVVKATGGNQEQMAKLFGSVEALKAVFPLTGTAAGKFATALDELKNSTGATDAAFAKMSGSIDLASQKIANSFKALLISFGTPLLDEAGGVANAIAKIFGVLAQNVEAGGLGKLRALVESIFKDIQTTLEQVAQNLPAALAKADFSGFEGGIKAVYEAFGLLFKNIDLRSVDGLTAAIELAGTAFLGLSKFTAGVIESFKPLLDLLLEVGSGVRGANVEWLESVGAIAGAVVQFNALLDAFGGLAPVLSTIVGLFVANQAASLVGALRLLSGLLPGTAASMLSLNAAVGALAGTLAVAEIVKLVDAMLQWKDATDRLKQSQEQSKDIQAKAADAVAAFAQRTGLAVTSLDEINDLINKGVVVWDDATQQYVKAADAQSSVQRETNAANKALEANNEAMIQAAAKAAPAAWEAQQLAEANKELQGMVQGVVPIIDAATGKVIGYEQGLVKASEGTLKLKSASEGVNPPLKTSADALEKLAGKSDLTNKELIELQRNLKASELELEKIASNERIKNIEFQVQLQVADIEAQTKRIQAAFESIDNTVNSTADVLNTLFGTFGKNLSFQEMFDIRQQIDEENRRRDEALALQKKLTEAQIEQMRAQTQALLRGDAMIKVDGAGLQPHLEAFMWEILRSIQIRVNQDGLGMLLGI